MHFFFCSFFHEKIRMFWVGTCSEIEKIPNHVLDLEIRQNVIKNVTISGRVRHVILCEVVRITTIFYVRTFALTLGICILSSRRASGERAAGSSAIACRAEELWLLAKELWLLAKELWLLAKELSYSPAFNSIIRIWHVRCEIPRGRI